VVPKRCIFYGANIIDFYPLTLAATCSLVAHFVTWAVVFRLAAIALAPVCSWPSAPCAAAPAAAAPGAAAAPARTSSSSCSWTSLSATAASFTNACSGVAAGAFSSALLLSALSCLNCSSGMFSKFCAILQIQIILIFYFLNLFSKTLVLNWLFLTKTPFFTNLYFLFASFEKKFFELSSKIICSRRFFEKSRRKIRNTKCSLVRC
jgi:hypothetical protein